MKVIGNRSELWGALVALFAAVADWQGWDVPTAVYLPAFALLAYFMRKRVERKSELLATNQASADSLVHGAPTDAD